MHEDVRAVHGEAVSDVAERRDDVGHRRRVRGEVRMHVADAELRQDLREMHGLREEGQRAQQRRGSEERSGDECAEQTKVTLRRTKEGVQVGAEDRRGEEWRVERAVDPRLRFYVYDAARAADEGNDEDRLALAFELVDLAEDEGLVDLREAGHEHGD